jgi:cytochrome c553
MDDRDNLTALFQQDVKLDSLMQSLREAGIADEQVSIMTPLPLSEQASARVSAMPLYLVTMIAGLVGIAVGVFFAGGTAAMYPLMTGGKPIVAVPIVAIISYETMMLLAIVMTFVTMIVGIKRAHRHIAERAPGIDDGAIMLVVSLPIDQARVSQIRDLLQQAGAVEIRSPEQAGSDSRTSERKGRVATAIVGLAALCLFTPFAGCSRDMQEQPSYQPQESPRLHSPVGSVPRDSRSVIQNTGSPAALDEGARLFRINCSHCHGMDGMGHSPVVPFLKEKPANLLNPEIQELSEEALYDTVTYGLAIEGKDVMPPFTGELSSGERRSVARYVKALSQP